MARPTSTKTAITSHSFRQKGKNEDSNDSRSTHGLCRTTELDSPKQHFPSDRSRSRGTHGMASPRSCCSSMEGIRRRRRRRRRKSCCWRRRRRHETSSFRRKRRDGESRSRTTCSALFIDAAKGWWEEKTCMLCLLCDRIFVRFLR
ncbi:unnamed protein product [Musa acuminata var. zebrina]